MSKPNNALIEPTTLAATFPATDEETNLFYIPQGETWTISATGLSGIETVAIKMWEGTAYNQWKVGGVLSGLDASNSATTITGPGYFQVVKSATGASIGVYKND